MGTTVAGWTTLAEDPLVLLREYSFGPGTANGLAIELPGRKLLLVSTPRDLSDADYAALRERGEVVAMVANNGAHYLGLSAAARAFPNAATYATERAGARIAKRTQAGRLLDLAELTPLLGDKVSVAAADGCKIGDLIVRVKTERGVLLYVGDFIANIPVLPSNFMFRLLFKLTNSGPGLKVFRIFFLFFTSDKRAARDFLIREIEAAPPAILVPGHGAIVERPQLGATLVSMLRAAI